MFNTIMIFLAGTVVGLAYTITWYEINQRSTFPWRKWR